MKHRIQIMLCDQQASYLKDVSERTGETVASIVRRAVAMLFSPAGRSPGPALGTPALKPLPGAEVAAPAVRSAAES